MDQISGDYPFLPACREKFTVVWKKFCSDYADTVDRLRRLLNATETAEKPPGGTVSAPIVVDCSIVLCI
jgi:hypothetical protein